MHFLWVESSNSRTIGRYLAPVVLLLATTLAGCSGNRIASANSEKKGGKKGDQVSPVSIASVSQKDVPLEISVIGNVEAYSAVTVRSQVGGELIKVHFKEGDYVKAGDLLLVMPAFGVLPGGVEPVG